MTWPWFLVTWTTFSCPGWFLGNQIPPKWRPIICQESHQSAIFSSRAEADRQVDKAGMRAEPQLWEQIGLRRKQLPVTFNP